MDIHRLRKFTGEYTAGHGWGILNSFAVKFYKILMYPFTKALNILQNT